jgi:hypothetical protein
VTTGAGPFIITPPRLARAASPATVNLRQQQNADHHKTVI